MKIDRTTLDGLARLAHLEIDAAEAPRLIGQLESILGMMQSLATVDVTGVSSVVDQGLAFDKTRPDVPRPSVARDLLLERAPLSEEGAFLVPRVIG